MVERLAHRWSAKQPNGKRIDGLVNGFAGLAGCDLPDRVGCDHMKRKLIKPIEAYKTMPPHVIAAKKLRARGVIVMPGMEIAYD